MLLHSAAGESLRAVAPLHLHARAWFTSVGYLIILVTITHLILNTSTTKVGLPKVPHAFWETLWLLTWSTPPIDWAYGCWVQGVPGEDQIFKDPQLKRGETSTRIQHALGQRPAELFLFACRYMRLKRAGALPVCWRQSPRSIQPSCCDVQTSLQI